MNLTAYIVKKLRSPAWCLVPVILWVVTGVSFADSPPKDETSRTKLLQEKYGLHEETIRTLEEINRAAMEAPDRSSQSGKETPPEPAAGSKTTKTTAGRDTPSKYPVYSPHSTSKPEQENKKKGFIGRLFSRNTDKKTDYKMKAEEEADRLHKRRAEQEQIRKKIEMERKAREAKLTKTSSSKSTDTIIPSEPPKVILPPPPATTVQAETRAVNSLGEPLMRPGLVIEISVYNHGEIEVKADQHRIAPNGNITLPLVGTTSVSGLTLNQLSERLTEKYRSYLKNPAVSVDFVVDRTDVTTMPWGYITVLGRVEKPGRIQLPVSRTMPLSTAIQTAGGFSSSAKTKAIKVTRKRPDGKSDEILKNLKNLGKDGQVDDMDLLPDDVVYVPERIF